jgi:predicted DNA-binding protein with PD1-like motif
MMMNATQYKNIAIIDSNSGTQLKNTDKPFILVLKPGENLFEGILRCADAANLKSASISGLGGLCEISLAYYNLETKQYQIKLFSQMHELISMNGNIATFEGKRFLHIHAAVSDENYAVLGGHLMSATVNPSAEISITPLTADIERKYDEVTGLKVMCPIGFHPTS